MTELDKLVTMANQIAMFFEAMPDRDAGRAGTAEHLRKFWAPSMRAALREALAAPHASDLQATLHPLLREALATHPDALA